MAFSRDEFWLESRGKRRSHREARHAAFPTRLPSCFHQSSLLPARSSSLVRPASQQQGPADGAVARCYLLLHWVNRKRTSGATRTVRVQYEYELPPGMSTVTY